MLALIRKTRNAFRRIFPAKQTPVSFSDPWAIDFGSPGVARDPFPHYEALRRHGPVHLLARHGYWIVLDYEEAKQALKQFQAFSNSPYARFDSVLLGSDPPAHTAVRTAVSGFFARGALSRLSGLVETRTTQLLKSKFDAVHDLAVPLVHSVALEFLGFTGETAAAVLAAAAKTRAAKATLDDLMAFLDRVAHHSNLYQELIAAGHQGVSEADARILVRFFWLAATTSSERVIVQAILCLLQHDEVRQQLQDMERLPAFIEEVLRLHPTELMVSRLTLAATRLGGVELPAGAAVQVCISAANRDPGVFEHPADFKLDRKPNDHLSFGHGVHHCIGAILGRQTAIAALGTLLRVAPQLQAAEPLAAIPYLANENVLTPARLVVRTPTPLP